MTPLRIAALIVVLLLAVAFAAQNTDAVNVSLLLWKPQASLAIVMALCLALGFLVGLLAVAPSFFKGRRHARNLQRQLAKLDAVSASQPSPMSPDVAGREPSERQAAR